MDNSSYINISRQSGLLKELNVIANNIANVDTTGFRREGAIFSEYVVQAGAGKSVSLNHGRRNDAVAIGRLGGHYSDFSTGGLTRTGGTLDLAIDGEGFFKIQTPNGERLTRDGHFLTNKDGILSTSEGYAVLDETGSSIQIPSDADLVAIGGDGTISANGSALGKVGVVTASPQSLQRVGGNFWQATGGTTHIDIPTIMQGFLEGSNVNPVIEIARMIEVQRAYEAGQKLLELEDERISKTVNMIRQAP